MKWKHTNAGPNHDRRLFINFTARSFWKLLPVILVIEPQLNCKNISIRKQYIVYRQTVLTMRNILRSFTTCLKFMASVTWFPFFSFVFTINWTRFRLILGLFAIYRINLSEFRLIRHRSLSKFFDVNYPHSWLTPNNDPLIFSSLFGHDLWF